MDAGGLAAPGAGHIQNAVIGTAPFEPSDDPRNRDVVRLIQIDFQAGLVVLFGKVDGQKGASTWFPVGENDGAVRIHHISFRAGRIVPRPMLPHLAVALGHSPLLRPASLGNPSAVWKSALHTGAQGPLVGSGLSTRDNFAEVHGLNLSYLDKWPKLDSFRHGVVPAPFGLGKEGRLRLGLRLRITIPILNPEFLTPGFSP